MMLNFVNVENAAIKVDCNQYVQDIKIFCHSSINAKVKSN